MPLLVICGIPGSGKSTRANNLKEYLEEAHDAEVIIVSEDTLKLDKNTSYSCKNRIKIPEQKTQKYLFLHSDI